MSHFVNWKSLSEDFLMDSWASVHLFLVFSYFPAPRNDVLGLSWIFPALVLESSTPPKSPLIQTAFKDQHRADRCSVL